MTDDDDDDDDVDDDDDDVNAIISVSHAVGGLPILAGVFP